MTWTDEHGPDRLYHKFNVYKPSGERIEGEFVFVLRPETDEAAVVALTAYVVAVRGRSPRLADQLNEQIDRIVRENRGEAG